MGEIEKFIIDLPAEVYSVLIISIIIWTLSFIAYFKFKKANPLVPPKGFLFFAEYFVEATTNLVISIMGKSYTFLTPLFGYFIVFILTSLLFSFTGLPDPMANYSIPLSLAAITFVLIHVMAIKRLKLKYLKRYFVPFWFFVPLNIISIPIPLISLSVRLFANSIIGILILEMIFDLTDNVSHLILGFLPPDVNILGIAVIPILSIYFTVFVAIVQTIVFTMISMMTIKLESDNGQDDEDDFKEKEEINLQTNLKLN